MGRRKILETMEFASIAWQTWLLGQRWFLFKNYRKVDVEIAHCAELELEGVTAYWLLLRCKVVDQAVLISVPVVLDEEVAAYSHRIGQLPSGQYLFDAWASTAFCSGVLKLILESSSKRPFLGKKHLYLVEKPPADLSPQLLSLDQSNTAVRFGSTHFLKAFRTVSAGMHPDEEINDFLTRRVFCNSVPMHGTLTWNMGTKKDSILLCWLGEWCNSTASAWNSALEFMAHGTGSFPHIAGLIGQALAHMHNTLGETARNFGSSTWSYEKTQWYSRKCRAESFATLAVLEQVIPNLAPDLSEKLRELIAYAQQILPCHSVMEAQRGGLLVQRCHGDFHLGQVIIEDQLVRITDFEGEPLRPMDEREARHSIWRDVAGLMRSIDYAVGVAAQGNELTPDMVTRGELSKAVFRNSYMGMLTRPFYSAELPLVEWFALEKAFYELRYEMHARPEWLHIPLAGIAEYMRGWVDG